LAVEQKLMKGYSAKLNLIYESLYFDALECLPLDQNNYPKEEKTLPQNSRYDSQIAIFGAPFQQKLAHIKYFMVRILNSI
jgi:hypothetical protein